MLTYSTEGVKKGRIQMSKGSRKFQKFRHAAGCDRIREENAVHFDTEEEAIKAGYRRAKR